MSKKGYLNSRGEPVPRVTEILRSFQSGEGLLLWAADQGSRRAFLANRFRAARAGTQLHTWVQETIEGRSQLSAFDHRLDPEQCQWAARAYESFRSWTAVYAPLLKTARCEVEVISDAHSFGGTCDLVAELRDGRQILADWKTSRTVSISHVAQLAAYRVAYEERYGRPVDEAWVVRLSKEEIGFEHRAISRAELDLGWQFFSACLRSYSAFKIVRDSTGLRH